MSIPKKKVMSMTDNSVDCIVHQIGQETGVKGYEHYNSERIETFWLVSRH